MKEAMGSHGVGGVHLGLTIYMILQIYLLVMFAISFTDE